MRRVQCTAFGRSEAGRCALGLSFQVGGVPHAMHVVSARPRARTLGRVKETGLRESEWSTSGASSVVSKLLCTGRRRRPTGERLALRALLGDASLSRFDLSVKPPQLLLKCRHCRRYRGDPCLVARTRVFESMSKLTQLGSRFSPTPSQQGKLDVVV